MNYQYECPSGHRFNSNVTPGCCASCGYSEDEGRGPIVDHDKAEPMVLSGTLTLVLPGKFDGFFSGSAVGQGCSHYENGNPAFSNNPDHQRDAEEVYESYRRARRPRRGRGYSVVMENLTPGGIEVLLDYAETCICVNEDEPDYGERAAARKVADSCRAILRSVRSESEVAR